MVYFIGSSSDTSIGSGTLVKWEEDEIEDINIDSNREEGKYLVTEKNGGSEVYCFDLMVLESNTFGTVKQLHFGSDVALYEFCRDVLGLDT